MSEHLGEQPRPTPRPGVESVQARVRTDLEARERLGIERYGTALQPHNGRIEHLIAITTRPEPAFVSDWRCRLCGRTGHALDTSAALDEFADHLHDAHHASGGHPRRRS